MTSEGLGELFKGDSADMCTGKCSLMSMGCQAEGLASADLGARTPIGLSGNFDHLVNFTTSPKINPRAVACTHPRSGGAWTGNLVEGFYLTKALVPHMVHYYNQATYYRLIHFFEKQSFYLKQVQEKILYISFKLRKKDKNFSSPRHTFMTNYMKNG